MTLTALTTFVLDYGVLWTSRRQAQNAADAGALAGVTALALDDRTWPAPAGGIVVNSATTMAQSNSVMGASPSAVVSSQCPSYVAAPNNINCIQVDVYRDGTNGSTTLPVYFARLFGFSSQRIKATATAQVLPANGSGCMRPWFITDRYNDVNNNGRFDSPPDTYSFPGYSVPADIGTAVVMHDNNGPSSYGQLDVGNGSSGIRSAVEHCVSSTTFFIGQTVRTKPGNSLGAEKQGIDSLLSWDPDAHWNSSTKTVVGGCAPTRSCACPTAAECPYNGAMSPRIVQAAVCDPRQADCNGSAHGAGTITITNILSMFLTGYSGGSGNLVINGVIVASSTGVYKPGPSVGPGGSFLTVRWLVR